MMMIISIIIVILIFLMIIRNESEPGCVVVCGASQMLPLAKRYFYQSLNKYDSDDDDAFPKYNLSQLVSPKTRVIRENETKHATWVTNI